MAPRGCQQYYTGTIQQYNIVQYKYNTINFIEDDEGDMRMFNIEHNNNENAALLSSTVYQRNLKYSLCFKDPGNQCGVTD